MITSLTLQVPFPPEEFYPHLNGIRECAGEKTAHDHLLSVQGLYLSVCDMVRNNFDHFKKIHGTDDLNYIINTEWLIRGWAWLSIYEKKLAKENHYVRFMGRWQKRWDVICYLLNIVLFFSFLLMIWVCLYKNPPPFILLIAFFLALLAFIAGRPIKQIQEFRALYRSK